MQPRLFTLEILCRVWEVSSMPDGEESPGKSARNDRRERVRIAANIRKRVCLRRRDPEAYFTGHWKWGRVTFD